jgi:putative membrane protein
MDRSEYHTDSNALKGLAAGIVAGLVAAAVMNQFQKLISSLMERGEKSQGAQSQQKGSPHRAIGRVLDEYGIDDPDDNAPERLANAIGKGAFDVELNDRQKETGGTALHYAFGASMGAVYGLAAEFWPQVTAGAGMPYGSAVWLAADEGVVPLLGLSKAPTEYAASTHAYALGSHLVYGATAEVVRRRIRRML